jgi:hypothetical protein
VVIGLVGLVCVDGWGLLSPQGAELFSNLYRESRCINTIWFRYMMTTVASNCTRRKQLTKECHHPTLHAITGLFLCAISLYRSWYGWTSSITASHRNWFHGSSCFDAGRGTLPSCEWPRNSNCAGAGMSPPASHNRQPGSILLGFLAEWVLVNQDRTCRWIMFSGSGNGAEHAVEDA